MIRRPPRSTQSRSSAASDVYKRQVLNLVEPWWELSPHVLSIVIELRFHALAGLGIVGQQRQPLQRHAAVALQDAGCHSQRAGNLQPDPVIGRESIGDESL